MSAWRRLGAFLAAPFVRHTFDAAPRPIDAVILEMAGRGAGPRVGRAEALSVPGVLRGRNLICSIATLPLVQYGPQNKIIDNPLLRQIDPDVANVVTLAQTLEDLLFEAISWWRITAFGWDGFPIFARHLDVSSVSLDPPATGGTPAPLPSGWDPREAAVWVDGKPVPGSEMIRFDSPNPGLLSHAGRAIRRAVLLDKAASMYADDPRPLDYFTPEEGADDIDDAEVEKILRMWKAERKKRGTAYVPRSLKYNSVDSPSPAELQLVELQQQAMLDIANGMGVDPEDLGISTTSRTYQNAVDRRRDRINDVLSPYMKAITDRLTMGDVTKRGHYVAFNLDDYLRSNPKERAEVQQIYVTMGAKSVEEIRNEEKLTPGAPKPAPALPPVPAGQPADEPASGDADSSAAGKASARELVGATFSEDGPMHFADLPMQSFTVDKERRTIEGVAMPYGQVVEKGGFKFRFLPGSLTWSQRSPGRVKLLKNHVMSDAHGFAMSLANVGNSFKVKFKVGRGAARDDLLQDAADGIYDGLSVGVDFDFATDVEMDDEGVMNVRHALVREVSVTAMPAFDDARVTKVAASRDGEITMDECTTCGKRHAPGACASTPPTPPVAAPAGLTLSDDQIKALLTRPGALDALFKAQPEVKPKAPEGTFTLSAEQLDALIKSGGLGVLLGMPQVTPAQPAAPEQRQPVDPTRRPGSLTAVTEPMPYRFDREGNLTRGEKYDFSKDLISGSHGDGEAMTRAQQFLTAMAPHFAKAQFATGVDVGDVAGLNPNRNRPDLYVDQKDFQYPIWDAISKGNLADITPFVLPKFATATGLTAAHSEGVEPTPGTFTATSQTITPSAVSGKVEITREAWDQGGNPQLSGIIWRQMTKSWFEALEASAVSLLDGLTPTGITLDTAAVDDVLVSQLKAALAALQFVRGGFRMRDFFLQIDLYQALVDAKDADGRSLLPLLGPVNADGTMSDFFADLNVAGLRGRPAWALAATGTVAASSYLFDRNDVHGWATAPQRLQFEYRVSHVDVGIWGYKATANTDLTGVREVIYDPA